MSGVASMIMWLKAKIWNLIELILEEFSPWLKWLVYDAILRVVVQFLMKRSERLRCVVMRNLRLGSNALVTRRRLLFPSQGHVREDWSG